MFLCAGAFDHIGLVNIIGRISIFIKIVHIRRTVRLSGVIVSGI